MIFGISGGDDGARTRDLCRDSTEAGSNLLKLRVTDGFFWRSEVPVATLIGPLLDPRPLLCKPLPKLDRGWPRSSTHSTVRRSRELPSLPPTLWR